MVDEDDTIELHPFDAAPRSAEDEKRLAGRRNGFLLDYYTDDRADFLDFRVGDPFAAFADEEGDPPRAFYAIFALDGGEFEGGPLREAVDLSVDPDGRPAEDTGTDDEGTEAALVDALEDGAARRPRKLPSEPPLELPARDVYTNESVYAVWNVDSDDGRIDLGVRQASFYDALAERHALSEELDRRLQNNDISHRIDSLPNRDARAPDFDALTGFENRTASVGLSLATLVEREDGRTQLLIGRRSERSPTERQQYETVPGGTVQPSDERDEGDPVVDTAIAEICEELLDDDEHEHRERIEEWIDDGRAHLDATGVGLSAVDGTVELSGLFYPSDPEAGEWLLDRATASAEHEELARSELPLDSKPEQLRAGTLSSDGALGVARGLQRARDEYGVDVGPVEVGLVGRAADRELSDEERQHREHAFDQDWGPMAALMYHRAADGNEALPGLTEFPREFKTWGPGTFDEMPAHLRERIPEDARRAFGLEPDDDAEDSGGVERA